MRAGIVQREGVAPKTPPNQAPGAEKPGLDFCEVSRGVLGAAHDIAFFPDLSRAENPRTPLTNPCIVVKYPGYAKQCGNKAGDSCSARGERWEPLTDTLQATSSAARDDRDGCSR